MQYKLTEFSHGAGCGCKLSPGVLGEILKTDDKPLFFKDLLVGNETKDDGSANGHTTLRKVRTFREAEGHRFIRWSEMVRGVVAA
jgi:hypothetical protein